MQLNAKYSHYQKPGKMKREKEFCKNQVKSSLQTKILIYIVVIIFSVITVKSSYCQKLDFGMSYGLNVSYWKGEMEPLISEFEQGMQEQGFNIDFSQSPRFGINIGFFFTYQPVKWFALQPEVNYINEGTKLKGSCNIEDIDVDLKMAFNTNYLHMPLMVRFITPSGWYVSAGPYLDFQTHSKIKVTASAMGESESDSQKLPNVNKFNYGIAGGLGYREDGIGVEFRYLNGMKPVLNEVYSGYSFKNAVFEVKIDICFGKKK
jgi:hypothetical protein